MVCHGGSDTTVRACDPTPTGLRPDGAHRLRPRRLLARGQAGAGHRRQHRAGPRVHARARPSRCRRVRGRPPGRRRRDGAGWSPTAGAATFQRADLTAPGVPAEVVAHCVDRARRARHPGQLRRHLPDRPTWRTSTGRSGTRWSPSTSPPPSRLAHARRRVMRGQGRGKIINVASLFSFLGGRQSPAYAATKAGVVGFTKAYCDELAEHGVQVNAIAPGYFATALTAATRADAEANRARRRAHPGRPVGRPGGPDGRRGVPGLARLRLRQRTRARRRRRLPRPLTHARRAQTRPES